MLGAIIGDIVGSVYEWNNIKTKDFPLLSPKAQFTDDTVMTVAVAKALLSWTPLSGRRVWWAILALAHGARSQAL